MPPKSMDPLLFIGPLSATILEIVDLLLAAGANAKAATRYNVTPLSLACINGNAAIIDIC